MNSRTFISSSFVSLFLAMLVVGSCGGADSNTSDTSKAALDSSATVTAVADDSAGRSPKVIAYYFHTTRRCMSCKRIEAYSEEAIEEGFKKELDDGDLQFLSVNIDEPENKHFAEDYRLYTKSLIICRLEGGKQVEWKNLQKVWQLIGSKDEFVTYVQDEITAFLGES